MALSPEQEWTLVACGLMAHADGIVEVGEWEQVLWMLDERIDDGSAQTWLDRLSDAAALREHMTTVPVPPPFLSEGILEKAWRMGLADGRGSEAEVAVHNDLANALGVSAEEASQWRSQWTEAAAARSELIAGFAALIAQADGEVSQSERAGFEDLLARLPLAAGTRGAMSNLIDEPPEMMMLVGGFTALAPEERRIAMLGLVPIVRADDRGDAAQEAFLDLAEAVAIGRDDAQRMLER